MLVEHLTKQGIRVSLYHTAGAPDMADRARSLDDLPSFVRDLIHSELVPRPSAPWFPGHYVVDCERYSRRLLSAFLKRQAVEPADFIYAQGLTGLAFVRARKHRQDIPPVGVNAHGYEMYQACFGLRERLVQHLMRPQTRAVTLGADVLFCFSGKVREIVVDRIGTDPARIVVIPNGVDESWIAKDCSEPHHPRRFLFVGRFERRKGIPELHQAIRLLGKAGWTLDLVGPIPERYRVHDARVRYHGPISDSEMLLQIYGSSDCMICPSFAEGMPTVLIEAMAQGVMMIGTDVGAVSELITDKTGFLLARPEPRLIAAAMSSVIDMPDDRLLSYKEACRQKACEYRWDRVTSRVLDAIQSMRAAR
jgi:glycosyltransferase involved in cell wall biosynthesis